MNGLVILLVTVCLHMAPDEIGPPWCHDEEMNLEIAGTSCYAVGQFVAVEWLGGHPKWDVAGWRCREIITKASRV